MDTRVKFAALKAAGPIRKAINPSAITSVEDFARSVEAIMQADAEWMRQHEAEQAAKGLAWLRENGYVTPPNR